MTQAEIVNEQYKYMELRSIDNNSFFDDFTYKLLNTNYDSIKIKKRKIFTI